MAMKILKMKEDEFKSWINKEDYQVEAKLDNGKTIMVYTNLKGKEVSSLGHFLFLYHKSVEEAWMGVGTK